MSRDGWCFTRGGQEGLLGGGGVYTEIGRMGEQSLHAGGGCSRRRGGTGKGW